MVSSHLNGREYGRRPTRHRFGQAFRCLSLGAFVLFSLDSKVTTRRKTSEEWACSGFTFWHAATTTVRPALCNADHSDLQVMLAEQQEQIGAVRLMLAATEQDRLQSAPSYALPQSLWPTPPVHTSD